MKCSTNAHAENKVIPVKIRFNQRNLVKDSFDSEYTLNSANFIKCINFSSSALPTEPAHLQNIS